jgi:hypothetical protein
MTFLIADGRRALQRGPRLRAAPDHAPRAAAGPPHRHRARLPAEVREPRRRPHGRRLPGAAQPSTRRSTSGCAPRRRASGARSEQGTRLLDDLLAAGEVSGADAFRLHDTYGFPIELTREIAAERGVPFAGEADFERLMGEQRARSRSDRRAVMAGALTVEGEPTTFTGYEHLEEHTTVTGLSQPGRAHDRQARRVALLREGGGQISDGGVIACEDGDCLVRVADVVRAGDDQAIVVETVDGELKAGERVVARVDRAARNATQANHTATHLLHAALRQRLGPHVHQAGSYVGPDKLRFDFSHTQRLSEEERRDVEDQVNAWILRNDPVRPLTTTLDEAQRLGRWPSSARSTATWCAWSRWATAATRASCAAAPRALHGRDRAVQDHQRGLERLRTCAASRR